MSEVCPAAVGLVLAGDTGLGEWGQGRLAPGEELRVLGSRISVLESARAGQGGAAWMSGAARGIRRAGGGHEFQQCPFAVTAGC